MNNFKQEAEEKYRHILEIADVLLIQQYYNGHSYKETMIFLQEKYGCSQKQFRQLLIDLNIQAKGKGYCSEQTKAKRKQTCIEKYGLDNPMKCVEIKEKAKQTTIEKYGVSNPAQAESVKEKIKQTNLEKYGCENVFQSDSIKKQIQETFQTKYNVNHPSLVPEIVEKRKQTKLLRYEDAGYNNHLQAKQTCLKKYGVENPAQAKEIKNKYKQTCLTRYGEDNVKKVKLIFERSWKKYTYKEQKFDSAWELAFYIYCIDNNINIEREPIVLTYLYNNTQHKYYVDFKIDDQLIEIKNNFLYKKMLQPNTIDNAKYNCLIANNVKIILNSEITEYMNYIITTYGKDYLKQFLTTKNKSI